MEMNKQLLKKNQSPKQLNCFLNNRNRHHMNTKMMTPLIMKSKPRKNARVRRKTAASSLREHHGMYQLESFSVWLHSSAAWLPLSEAKEDLVVVEAVIVEVEVMVVMMEEMEDAVAMVV